jgi:hypothetical protein
MENVSEIFSAPELSAEETSLLTSKQDKVKHQCNEVMTIPTLATEMRHARNNSLLNRDTFFSNTKALPF